MKIVVVSPKNRTVYNFRGDLIKGLISEGFQVIVTGPNRDSVNRIHELGARFEQISLDKNGLSIRDDLAYVRSLFKLLKKEKPDLVLSYTVKPVVYGSFAAWLARVPRIISMITGAGYVFAAETTKARLVRRIVSFLYKIGLYCSDVVIFQNEDDLNEFVTRGLVKKEKTSVVNGSGVNMEEFKKTDYPQNLTFFMLARLLHSKGVREFLEAAERVKTRYPFVKFMLLGALESHQDSLSIDDLKPYVERGVVDYFGETDDVRPFFSRSSVFVLPSYREGTPRTVLEAMAMGRPIITTDAPGCRETVVDGLNGFLVPIKDVNALVEKMVWFVENVEKVPVMGQASWDYCRSKFDVRKVNEAMFRCMGIR